MPKPAGTAVDSRNGAQVQAAAASRMRKFSLPKRADGQPWRLETRKAWSALWADEALAGVLLPPDRLVLLRWADAVDRAARHLELGDASPISKGSMGQEVESPHYGIADKALKVAQACEAQLGVGALNRARLGIAVLAERAGLADLAARFPGDGGGFGESDPRLG